MARIAVRTFFAWATILGLLGTGEASPGGISTGSNLPLRDETFRSWQTAILSRPEELAWQRIPWRTSLRVGLVEAGVVDKPLLLWIMNGHPMGCT